MNLHLHHFVLALTIGLGLGGNAHAAAEVQPISDLLSAVERYLQNQILDAEGVHTTIAVNPIDTRLRLAACKAGLETFLPPGQRIDVNVTVGVRCPQPSWTVYVPAQMHRHADILVAKRPLVSGKALEEEDVGSIQADVTSLGRGYFPANTSLVGHTTKRAIAPGAVLNGGMLSPPLMVKRGDRVAIVAAAGGLEVRVSGIALADGMQGGRIAVRNASSNRVVQTIITQPGTVEVRL